MAVIGTKIFIPKARSKTISRPGLMEKLNKGLNCKLTLITAPSGYGKTTIVSEWARENNVKTVWVSLDNDDNDKIRFWTHTIEAITQSVQDFEKEEAIQLIISTELFLASLLNSLNHLDEPIVIVWDDFHNIIDENLIKGINYLVSRLSKNVHLYVISRNKFPLRISKLRAANELNELNINNLRFDKREIIQFLNEFPSLNITNEEKIMILERTEGWITGIKLVIILLEKNDSKLGLLNDVLGKQCNIAQYFFEEVLEKQTEDMKLFLLQTSILPRFNRELCEAATDLTNDGELLYSIEKESLFIVPLDEAREWFRYHHLFQEFLVEQLKNRTPNHLVKELHTRAGKWFEEHSYYEEALNHYVACEKYLKAIKIIEKTMPKLVEHEKLRVHKWLNKVPDHILIKKPMLYLFNLACLFLAGHKEAAEKKYWRAVNQLELNEISLKESDLNNFRAGLLFFGAFKGYLIRDFKMAIDYSERFVKIDPKGCFFDGFGSYKYAYHPLWDIHLSSRNLVEAEKVLKCLVEIWENREDTYFYAHLCLDYGRLLYEWNRLEEAEQYFMKTIKVGKLRGNISLEAIATLLLIEVLAAQNKDGQANFLLDNLNIQVNYNGYPKLAQKVTFFIMRRKWQEGHIEIIRKWLQSIKLYEDDDIPLEMIREYILLANLLIEDDQIDKAEDLLLRLLAVCRREERQGDSISLLIQLSMLYERKKQNMQSFYILEEALYLAQEDMYIRTFVDKGKPLVKLLRNYLSARQSQSFITSKNISLDYLKKLLRLFPIEFRDLYDKKIVTGTASILTERELEVLQHINKGLSNKEIAVILSVSTSTIKTHINNIYRKLQVKNRMQAVQRAKQLNLLNL